MPNLVTILPEMWKSLCKSPLISLRFSCVNLNKFFKHSQKNVQIITFFHKLFQFFPPTFSQPIHYCKTTHFFTIPQTLLQ